MEDRGKPSQNVFSASSHGELCGTNSNTEQTMPHIRGQPSACPGGQPLIVQPPGQGGFHGLSISLGSGAAVSNEEPTLMTVKGQMYQPEKEVQGEQGCQQYPLQSVFCTAQILHIKCSPSGHRFSRILIDHKTMLVGTTCPLLRLIPRPYLMLIISLHPSSIVDFPRPLTLLSGSACVLRGSLTYSQIAPFTAQSALIRANYCPSSQLKLP